MLSPAGLRIPPTFAWVALTLLAVPVNTIGAIAIALDAAVTVVVAERSCWP